MSEKQPLQPAVHASSAGAGPSLWTIVCSVVALVLAGCAGAALVALTLGSREAQQTHVWRAEGVAGQHAYWLAQMLRNSSTNMSSLAAEEVVLLHKLQDALHERNIGGTHGGTASAAPAAQKEPSPTPAVTTPVVTTNAAEAITSEGSGAGTTAAVEVKLPTRWADVKTTTPLAADVVPKALVSAFPGGAPPKDPGTLQFHWVITSCDRHQWGRMITHTLLTGLLNGLRPTTLSVVWCKKYEEGHYPSLLRNLRHSHALNVFFPNDALLAETSQVSGPEATYMTALMVPRALGMAHLPLLITEDDVVVAPDANIRLGKALAQVQATAGNDPVLLQGYTPQGVGPAPTSPDEIPQRVDDLGNAGPSHDTSRSDATQLITYGAQGFFFTPGMTELVLNEMLQFTVPGAKHDGHLQDMHVFHLVSDKWKCNQPGSSCWFYSMSPSLVQHIGTSSSLFNKDDKGNDVGLNQRWHLAHDFPVRVSFPGYDAQGVWRRLARRLTSSFRTGASGAGSGAGGAAGDLGIGAKRRLRTTTTSSSSSSSSSLIPGARRVLRLH